MSSEKALLLQEINDLGRQMSTQTVLFHQAIAEKAGLAGTDHKYLDLLFQHGAMTAGKLAELTGLTTGAVTGLIDRLEKQGLVRRERSDEDRRKVLVVLERAETMKRLGPAFEQMLKGLEKLYTDFSDQDLQVIKRYLHNTIAFYQEQIDYLKK